MNDACIPRLRFCMPAFLFLTLLHSSERSIFRDTHYKRRRMKSRLDSTDTKHERIASDKGGFFFKKREMSTRREKDWRISDT